MIGVALALPALALLLYVAAYAGAEAIQNPRQVSPEERREAGRDALIAFGAAVCLAASLGLAWG